MLGPNFFMSKAIVFGRLASISVLFWGWAFVLPAAEQSLTLERQLLAHAPEMLKQLRDRNCTRIGVLKFRVENPGVKVSDQAGTLNIFVAERLEAALALANRRANLQRRVRIVAAGRGIVTRRANDIDKGSTDRRHRRTQSAGRHASEISFAKHRTTAPRSLSLDRKLECSNRIAAVPSPTIATTLPWLTIASILPS